MFISVIVKNHKNVNNTCLITKDIYNYLNLSLDKSYKIKLGQILRDVNISIINGNNKILLPKNFFNALFSNEFRLCIWRDNNNICIGPVIGVFVNPNFIKKISDEYTPISAQCNAHASYYAQTLIYYFSIDDINWINKKINGFVYLKNNATWEKFSLPLPDIIYDKAVRFNNKQKPVVNFIRNQLNNNTDIKFINNQNYLSKWDLYDRLCKYKDIVKYLPDTIRFNSFDNIIMMLNKYNFIFLKSFYGSRGEEVLSIERINNKFKLNYFAHDFNEIIIDNLENLEEFINSFFGEKQFIIQQGLRFFKHNNRKLDLRILLNKNIYGKWKVISNIARLAKVGFNITYTNSGGDFEQYTDIYPYLHNPFNVRYPVNNTINNITIKIAKYIEKEFGTFGELGMDMAIDENGHVFFLEANTKPTKGKVRKFDEMLPNKYIPLHEYAKYLVKGER